jgi:alkylation response protein AidB-like acyl-CoA dehydrogenase
MIALVEANQSWLETITYQMCHMPYKQQAQHLAGPIGLLKLSATRAAHDIADEAVQIWGGRGLTQTGMGKYIEMFQRTFRFDAGMYPSDSMVLSTLLIWWQCWEAQKISSVILVSGRR